MGSMAVALPVPYLQLMINSLEIIGNFMYPADAYRNLLALVRAGRLDPADDRAEDLSARGAAGGHGGGGDCGQS